MKRLFILAATAFLTTMTVMAQQNTNLSGQNRNYISTGMPILMVAPDALSGAMGDAGAASEPDAYSAHWNNAKFAFTDNDVGISTTYTPWLRNLGLSDMNLLYLGAYKRINKNETLAASITYFSLGDIKSTSAEGNDEGTFSPNEMAVDATYAMKLNKNLSLGATGRYIRSDLTNGMTINDGSGYRRTKAAPSVAADVGLYYENTVDNQTEFAIGGMISNLGAKLSYSDDDPKKEFLPANLRIGGRYSYEVDSYNAFNILLDFNKLLVPTPPINDEDNNTYGYYENMTDYYNTGVVQGVFNSFFDAPGGFREELQELQISFGAEYWYNHTFAARAGYFYEHANKGGRKYLTVGFGVKFNMTQFDFAYLLPTTQYSTNPLANTIRISLTLNLAKQK